VGLCLRELGRCGSGSSLIGDDLAQVIDAVLSEGRHAVLADGVHPEAAVLRPMSIGSSKSQSSSSPRRLAT
jgi:hypothetical protein